MHGVKPITAEHSPSAKPAELHNVKPANSEGLPGQCYTLIGSERVPVQKYQAVDPYYKLLSYDSNKDQAVYRYLLCALAFMALCVIVTRKTNS